MQLAAKFKKKPVVIEAMYFDGSYASGKAIMDWADHTVYRSNLVGLNIKTLEGDMHVTPGDWVIRGVHGEFYPCKPDIFNKTYEPYTEEPYTE